MTMTPPNQNVTTRRQWLFHAGAGFGGLALTHLLATEGALGDAVRSQPQGGLHHAPHAKRVVQLFMNGGTSQSTIGLLTPNGFSSQAMGPDNGPASQ